MLKAGPQVHYACAQQLVEQPRPVAMHQCVNEWSMHQCANANDQRDKCTNAPMRQCDTAPMRHCATAPMHQYTKAQMLWQALRLAAEEREQAP